MSNVVSIHEAKTQLSKLIKRASQGETIYIGAYGKPDAVLGPLPIEKPRKLGVWGNRYDIDYEALDQLDSEIADELLESS